MESKQKSKDLIYSPIRRTSKKIKMQKVTAVRAVTAVTAVTW